MSQDNVKLIRSAGELTVYYPGEAGTLTESNPATTTRRWSPARPVFARRCRTSC
ncbi:MAG: hypothetical protein M5U09_22085 [Gammaproteobacteria bacterium]|nr:hypothetical protein [Gammaproteobacteria bacterium]